MKKFIELQNKHVLIDLDNVMSVEYEHSTKSNPPILHVMYKNGRNEGSLFYDNDGDRQALEDYQCLRCAIHHHYGFEAWGVDLSMNPIIEKHEPNTLLKED